MVEARRDGWRSRTQSAAAQRERQRRHRLREKVQPREPARPHADPWELGAECLDHLQRVRAAIGANVSARHHLDAAQELVRQLAHGPLSEDSCHAKLRSDAATPRRSTSRSGEGAGMAEGKVRLPPRWFVVIAWHVHRWVVRATGGAKACGPDAGASPGA